MADIVNVGFKVRTNEIEKGYKRLGKMGEQAEKAEGKLNKMAKGATAAGSAVATIGTATTAAAAAVAAFMNHLANVERELRASARMAGLTTDQFEAMGFAYRQFGLTVEQVNDIYKDSREKVGQWLTDQTGGLEDFGNAMGMNKDELTKFAKEIDGLTGQQLLQRMVDEMQAAGVSASQMSFALEGMASEATRMIPALENNGQAINSLSSEYVKFNAAFSLNDEDVQNYADLAKNFDLFLDTAQNGITKTLSPLAEVMGVLALEATEFLAALASGSIAAAQKDYSDALAEQLEARRLLGEAQNIPAAFGRDVIDQETRIAQERLDSANKAVEAADKQLEAAKKTAQSQLEVNRTSTRNVNVRLTLDEIKEREKATEKARKALEQQAISYDRWLESVRASADPVSVLQDEIAELWLAMMDGDLSTEIATKRIEQLNGEIKDLQKTKNPYEGLASGAMEYLTAIQMLSKDGSDSFKELERAIAAVSITQSLATGNIAGAIASGASLITTFDKGLGDDISAEIQANQNLDDLGEKADSISIATKTTADATDKLVGINTKMLNALKTVQNGITGASGMIARDRAKTSIDIGGLGILDNLLTSSGLGSFLTDALDIFNKFTFNFLGSIGSSIFKSIGGLLGGSSKVKDEGIRIIGGSLSQLMDDVTVQAFQTVKYKKWRFGSSKTKTKFVDAGNSIGNQFSLVFESIADSVAAGADILGLSQDEIEKRINSFRISTQTISLKGLSASRQQKEIEAYFSRVFNNLTVSVIPFIRELQMAGEELGETLSRVATQTSIAEYLVDNFGVTFVDKMADPRAFAIAADNLANFAGGAEALAEQVSSFTDAFASDTTKLNIYQESLISTLRDVGLSLPTTSEGLFDLMSSLDGTTEAGQEQIATLLKITGTADAYYKLLDNTAGRYREAAESLFDVSFAVEKVALDSAVAAARLGDFSLAEALDLKSLTPSKSDFSSLIDYNIARAETAAKLNELADLQTGKVSVDEKQLNVLEQIRDSLQNQATKEAGGSMISKLTEQMTALKSEFQEVSRQLRYGTITTTQEV